MMIDIIKHIIRAKDDDQALLQLIDGFQPLLRKYTRKLGYDDAYQDLQFAFIKTIYHLQSIDFKGKDNQSAKAYIKRSVISAFLQIIRKNNHRPPELVESSLSDKQCDEMEEKSAYYDSYDGLDEYGLKCYLTEKELDVLYHTIIKGETSQSIANKEHVSKQAINQIKNRAIKKIQKQFTFE